ncbi:hypothetical protein BJV82DRAFT_627256 [Fennellomyces sp. T-0311]|nr:hypothetical protein BJV82DRAFT_627256 [Fennellomyces sp. T-0311]
MRSTIREYSFTSRVQDPSKAQHDQPKTPQFASLADIAALEKDQYFTFDDPYRALKKEKVYNEHLNNEVDFMIMNSIDAGHYEGALHTVREMLLAQRCCSKITILHLFDLILRPGDAYEHMSAPAVVAMVQNVSHILFMVLETFGSKAFTDIWNVFYDTNSSRRRLRKRAFSVAMVEETDEVYESSLSEFSDFQELFASCIRFNGGVDQSRRRKPTMRGPSMKAPAAHYRRRVVLGVLLAVLEDEFRQTGGDPAAIESCTLLKIVDDSRRFHQWLDIIFSTLSSDMDYIGQDTDTSATDTRMIHAELGSRFLNMLIAASYCGDSINSKELLFQSFRRLSSLAVDGCATFMHMIKFKTFVFTIFDMAISDANVSKVPTHRKALRKQKVSLDFMEKFVQFDLKTRPFRLDYIDDVYRHVQLTVWKFMIGTNLRCTLNDLNEEHTGIDIAVLSKQTIKEWKSDIDDMVCYVQSSNTDNSLDVLFEDKVRWAVSLAESI